ncbi:MAG: cytochrome c biogenesis protein CcdA [Desulfobacterales bacterium]|nr:cytochrome c biogenesis protein CcdA [Desulfobacterales bacterium]
MAIGSLVLAPQLAAQEEPSEAVLQAATVWSVDRARPGDRIGLAIVMQIAPGFHINANAAQLTPQPTFKPFPTQIQVLEAPPDVRVESAVFPQAHDFEADFAQAPIRVFDGTVPVLLPVVVAPTFAQKDLRIKIDLAFQACDAASCLFPETLTLTANLPAAAAGEIPRPVAPDLFAALGTPENTETPKFTFAFGSYRFSWAAAGSGFILILALATFGGFMLNFTPCVLPLIPIKIMSLSNAAQNRLRCFLLGLATFFGLMAFWLLLGLAIAFSSKVTAVNQLFQLPFFTITVGLVIAVLAIGMCGAFAIPLPQFVYRLNPREETVVGAFGIGILSAILSTPCTAPVMGTAAAWAATQPPAFTLAVFAAIGVGMALPYLVLSAAPGLVQRMPRSGPLGEIIKQTMGLFLMAAATYFLGAGLSALFVRPPDPPSRFYWWGVMGFIAAGGIWAAVRLVVMTRRRRVKAVCVLAGLAVLAAAIWGGLRFTDDGPVDWVYYTEERYQRALADEQVVVMVFSAAWCLNCKALEHSVLRTRSVVDLLAQADVAPFKVDITANNPAGMERLKQTGYLTIPLLVVYSSEGREVMKASFYTVADLVAAVAAARPPNPS